MAEESDGSGREVKEVVRDSVRVVRWVRRSDMVMVCWRSKGRPWPLEVVRVGEFEVNSR